MSMSFRKVFHFFVTIQPTLFQKSYEALQKTSFNKGGGTRRVTEGSYSIYSYRDVIIPLNSYQNAKKFPLKP